MINENNDVTDTLSSLYMVKICERFWYVSVQIISEAEMPRYRGLKKETIMAGPAAILLFIPLLCGPSDGGVVP